jgi:hypothetical protein
MPEYIVVKDTVDELAKLHVLSFTLSAFLHYFIAFHQLLCH